MPKHMTPQEKWQELLQTLAGKKEITVSSISEEVVTFHSTPEALASLRLVLGNDAELRSKVNHAISISATATQTAAPIYAEQELVSEAFKLNGEGLLRKITNHQFRRYTAGNFSEYDDNSEQMTATWKINTLNDLRSTVSIDNLRLLQSALGNTTKVAEILADDKAPKLSKESDDGSITSFGEGVLSFAKVLGGVQVNFNYGRLLQAVQNELPSTVAPVIACENSMKEEYSISLKVIDHLANTIKPNVIVNDVDDLIIAFSPSEDEQNIEEDCVPSLHLVLDTSGSMRYDFAEYIGRINDFIKKVGDEHSNWKIKITAFSDSANTIEFSSKGNTIENILDYTNALKAEGFTALYSTIEDAIKNATKASDDKATLVIFTDGSNNGYRSEEDVLDASAELLAARPQVKIVTVGYGSEYSASFFAGLIAKGGWTHMHLGNITEINELSQYLANICKNSNVLRLSADGTDSVLRVDSGDVAISDSKLAAGSEITINGKDYIIGVETGLDTLDWLNAGKSTCPAPFYGNPSMIGQCGNPLFVPQTIGSSNYSVPTPSIAPSADIASALSLSAGAIPALVGAAIVGLAGIGVWALNSLTAHSAVVQTSALGVDGEVLPVGVVEATADHN